MSIKFNLTGHKKLWLWLAEHPGKMKHDYFEIMGIEDKNIPVIGCYACQYDDSFHVRCSHCPLCILDAYPLRCLNGLYDEWSFVNNHVCFGNYGSDDLEECYRLARKIANLPVREGVECI